MRGSNAEPSRGGYRPGDAQLRVRLQHVVLLHERLFGELPVHGEPERVPPLGPHRLHLPRVEDGGGRLDALAQRRRVVVEVDPGAPAPRLAAHRREVDVVGLQVVLGEGTPLRHEGVAAVEAVAPPVERAGEPARRRSPRPSTIFTPRWRQAFWNARTSLVVGAHHDDRLVEDLVLDEVAHRRGSPRAGTPSATPAATAARPPCGRSPGRSSAPSAPGPAPPSRTARTSPPTRPRRRSDATPCRRSPRPSARRRTRRRWPAARRAARSAGPASSR